MTSSEFSSKSVNGLIERTTRYLVSPDSEHYLFLKQYYKEYPNAKLIGGLEVTDKFIEEFRFFGSTSFLFQPKY